MNKFELNSALVTQTGQEDQALRSWLDVARVIN